MLTEEDLEHIADANNCSREGEDALSSPQDGREAKEGEQKANSAQDVNKDGENEQRANNY
jgi:hypothetical protein